MLILISQREMLHVPTYVIPKFSRCKLINILPSHLIDNCHVSNNVLSNMKTMNYHIR